MQIRDIIKRNGDFYRFSVVDCGQNRFALRMEEKPFSEKWGNAIRIETSAKRLEQLANEILNYLKRKVQWKEWKPTMEEYERRLEEIRPEHGVEIWFIDWVRNVKTLRREGQIKEVQRIYEWLKSNEKWLYGKD